MCKINLKQARGNDTHSSRNKLSAAKSLQSCPTLCDPIDGSPPGSPSLGFSRQEHWSGLSLLSPMRESEVARSCLTLCDPMDCSLPGFSIHGIFQARVLEWGAIAFSGKLSREQKNNRKKMDEITSWYFGKTNKLDKPPVGKAKGKEKRVRLWKDGMTERHDGHSYSNKKIGFYEQV